MTDTKDLRIKELEDLLYSHSDDVISTAFQKIKKLEFELEESNYKNLSLMTDVSQLREELSEACRYAGDLFETVWPQCKRLNNIGAIISQFDNGLSDYKKLNRNLKELEARNQALEAGLRKYGYHLRHERLTSVCNSFDSQGNCLNCICGLQEILDKEKAQIVMAEIHLKQVGELEARNQALEGALRRIQREGCPTKTTFRIAEEALSSPAQAPDNPTGWIGANVPLRSSNEPHGNDMPEAQADGAGKYEPKRRNI